MRTDDLIAELAAKPWPATRPAIRLAFAMTVGWVAALAGLIIALGAPLAAVGETGAMPFALKLGYTTALTFITAALALAVGKPGQRLGPRLLLVGLPVAIIAGAATLELASIPLTAWDGLMFGSTFTTCVSAISIASLPVLAAVIWAMRVLAPTRLMLAGFISGLSAGAAGAVAYALYCPETTASFLMASYTPGILIPAVIGAVLGPRLLRW